MYCDEIIVVEPGADSVVSHQLEKLELFLEGFNSLGIKCNIFCNKNPKKDFGRNSVSCNKLWVNRLRGILPGKIYVWFLEFLCYYRAFVSANKKQMMVLGLTVSAPYGVLIAYLLSRPKYGVTIRVLNFGLISSSAGSYQVNKKCINSWKILISNGVNIVKLTSTGNSLLCTNVTNKVGSINTIPEIVSCPNIGVRIKSAPLSLLVVGCDDGHRRNALMALVRGGYLRGLKELHIHAPGHSYARLADGSKYLPPLGVKVKFTNNYITGEELTTMVRSSSACLIGYQQGFCNPSSVLYLSVMAGVPVLSSNFPDGIYSFDTCGKLGEMFKMETEGDLSRAWGRFLEWGDLEYGKFSEAREKLRAMVNPLTVARRHLEVY